VAYFNITCESFSLAIHPRVAFGLRYEKIPSGPVLYQNDLEISLKGNPRKAIEARLEDRELATVTKLEISLSWLALVEAVRPAGEAQRQCV
jgi:hypothetical protein